ncbi:hypothetical protein QAO71_17625 (plasmid) [Halopseudomonas sp. SMJS2]|uniref:hypothetical protein n=1 Tax=Halopseudomonas sp. SMJS2 TaxID=3041098 RepID=UPI002452A1C8|nr:hypothetical protein [Halopseudomonas sp. SMJS2]WGK63362.1 hypothetical protein QAO71_17625 [Halopseudomonas sp. SMJS2]
MKTILLMAFFSWALLGCSIAPMAPPSTAAEKAAKVDAASRAVKIGRYNQAELLLSDYVYRSAKGSLKLRRLALTGETRTQAIDTVTSLLWETGRDVTLTNFAADYLPRYERDVTLCRLSERQARYQDAYRCWNELGHVDRADRVLRTQATIEILRD